LDGIFDSLALNKTVDFLKLTYGASAFLILGNSNSLRFIENNSTLKTLDLNHLMFTEEEMIILSEALLKNVSLTELNFSFSNFKGPFGFLQNKNLKVFSFMRIWKTLEKKNFKDFIYNLKHNSSLIDLDLSIGHSNMENLREIIGVLSQHKSIEILKLNRFSGKYDSIDFHKLLKNPTLKELKLNRSIRLVESLENILQGLNENQTLLTLDISGNDLDKDLSTFKFKITNETLQKLNLTNISCFFFNNIFFSNLDLLRNLVSIPSLENFYIRENHLGRLGVEILCNKLKQDSNLKTLSFNGN
jgi:hypothetical protein